MVLHLLAQMMGANNATRARGGGECTTRKIRWGCAARFPRPLFMTKICDIPYPIYDLTKNLKPHLWHDSEQQSPVQTNGIVDFLFDNDEKVASS